MASPGLQTHTQKRMLLELDDDWAAAAFEGQTSVRRFKDSIHDYLPFGQTICAIVDTPQFQRLRNIKQLGTSYYVWPGASHNRFEHCLGVAYLAQTLAMHLRNSQPSLGITQRDVQCVTIAGLCHDLGHGPWSHVWDSLFIPTILPEKTWCHEDASRMMFDALLEENGLELHEDDATFVKALIMGTPSMCKKKEKPYLFQIVANKTNGLDVDKFDYIARDSHAIDQTSNLSLTRLIYSSRVIDDDICYDIKDANQVFELCHTRMSLHKRIYTHKTGELCFQFGGCRPVADLGHVAKAIEYMIVDALKLAEPVMNIARRLEDPKKYLHLTDHIQTEIEASEDPRLEEAQKILHRIKVRDLYKTVDNKVFPWDQKADLKAMFTPESVVKAFKELYAGNPTLDSSEQLDGLDNDPEKVKVLAEELSPEHVIIDLTERHHGMKDENPLHFMKFYSKHHPDKGIYANEDNISVTLPRAFGELLLRVYTRESRFFGVVQRGYRKVLKAFSEMQERKAASSGLFLDDSGNPLDADVDLADPPVHPVTPPAEAPTTPKLKPQQPRTMSRVPTRTLSRHPSGVVDGGVAMTPIQDNPFTGVGATYNPKDSPAKKGKKRQRETEAGKEKDAIKEKQKVDKADEGLDLALEFDPELSAPGGSAKKGGGSPPRKKSKP
ncbi:HD-domain/PDEase-like protein [Dichomitus squalens]|uniref:HD-domain/PDEase-like protein n=1 Tax=Dichomitus squalens TaxID=114155 RepID=A0A4Q9QBQ3_9APHY|nr:HD-domain/PDEase-like protein [Dichomitus squalens]TBU65152.1 HD-domain/PDEase-like protein [Dichomitus squalens]